LCGLNALEKMQHHRREPATHSFFKKNVAKYIPQVWGVGGCSSSTTTKSLLIPNIAIMCSAIHPYTVIENISSIQLAV
jgi:hypothetical protein